MTEEQITQNRINAMQQIEDAAWDLYQVQNPDVGDLYMNWSQLPTDIQHEYYHRATLAQLFIILEDPEVMEIFLRLRDR